METAGNDVAASPIPGVVGVKHSLDQSVSVPSPADLRNKLQTLSAAKTVVSTPTAPAASSHTEVTGQRLGATPLSANAAGSTSQPMAREECPRTSSSKSIGSSNLISLREGIKSSTIMVVDDEELNILTVCNYLKKEGYQSFVSVTDARETLKVIRARQPDCLLLDINMPYISGIDILRTKSFDPILEHIPTIVLTAVTDPTIKRQALDLGAFDFIAKPVDPNELIPRVRNVLMLKSQMDHIAKEAARLDSLVQRRTAELTQSRQQLILSLARAAEHRDNETGNHVIRVGRYAGIIARQLGWTEDKAQMLEQAAQLHDVGKIGIPDAILFKPGKLDPQEFSLIRKHCAMGKEIIEPLSQSDFDIFKSHTGLGSDIVQLRGSPMLMMAARIAQTHHERWDGTGYPLGIAGTDIPLEGRITSVADVFDALSSERPYKKALPREKCFEILREGRGTQFDPNVLDAFFARSADIIEVQLNFMDLPTTTR